MSSSEYKNGDFKDNCSDDDNDDGDDDFDDDDDDCDDDDDDFDDFDDDAGRWHTQNTTQVQCRVPISVSQFQL